MNKYNKKDWGIFSKMFSGLFRRKLSKKDLSLIPSSYDVVGDLLIFSDFPKELKWKEKVVAERILKEKKNVKVVLKKVKNYSGTYRTPKFKIIGGRKGKKPRTKKMGLDYY